MLPTGDRSAFAGEKQRLPGEVPGFGHARQFLFLRSAGADLPVQLESQVQQEIDDGIVQGQRIRGRRDQERRSLGESFQGGYRREGSLGIFFQAGDEGGPFVIQEAMEIVF